MSDPTMNHRDPLDDAIDRTVRDMTHVAADDDAVARVMARLREADTRGAGGRWILAPRLAWAGAVALLLVAIAAVYSLRQSGPDGNERRVAVIAPPQSSKPPLAAREIPTPAVDTPSTMQATTARNTRGRMVKPSSVANGAVDASERRARATRDAQPELPPLESDIEIASITPAPLGDAPAIHVAPLVTSSLTVDAIPVPSIDMAPVSPEQQR